MFIYGMKAPMNSERYRGRLAKVFDFLGKQGPIEERARTFADRAKTEPEWLMTNLFNFAQSKKSALKKESSIRRLRNYFKSLKLFCEMNDIAVSWKKITIGLPKARRFADDRSPTLDEIHRIIDYPDRRIKPVSERCHRLGCA
jgi:hypothetical protein